MLYIIPTKLCLTIFNCVVYSQFKRLYVVFSYVSVTACCYQKDVQKCMMNPEMMYATVQCIKDCTVSIQCLKVSTVVNLCIRVFFFIPYIQSFMINVSKSLAQLIDVAHIYQYTESMYKSFYQSESLQQGCYFSKAIYQIYLDACGTINPYVMKGMIFHIITPHTKLLKCNWSDLGHIAP